MNPNLQRLIELQKLDTIIAELDAEIHSLPQRIARIERQLSEHIEAVERDRKNLAENQRSRRKRETEIAALRDKISRYKEQVFDVKTNDQYRALLHEIEFHESQIHKIEEAILVEMIESESLEARLRETEQKLAEERSLAQQEIAAAEQRKREDEEKVNAVRGRRSEMQDSLPPDVYRQYERVARFRKGVAVVAAGNGSCGACHVVLRPQAFNDVKTNEQILTCESCGRILYYEPEPEPPAE